MNILLKRVSRDSEKLRTRKSADISPEWACAIAETSVASLSVNTRFLARKNFS